MEITPKEARDKKINVIKAGITITGPGPKGAKDLVEGAPSKLKDGVSKEDAEKFKKQLAEAGATAELKSRHMTTSYPDTHHIRKSFEKIPELVDVPNLLEIQRKSYDLFLQKDQPPDERKAI